MYIYVSNIHIQVTIVGELSLLPWMGKSDLRAALHKPSPPSLARCFCLHAGGKGAISQVILYVLACEYT